VLVSRGAAPAVLIDDEPRPALENLSYRERRVLELRYCLGDQHPRTLDEVARAFNVTREPIRQIEHHSLKKLPNLGHAQKLRDDFDIALRRTMRSPALRQSCCTNQGFHRMPLATRAAKIAVEVSA
jgi:Sigma-70, region 4